ncbi:serine hydrolase [Tenacibaculum sp. C7A-26P2]|uniref:serine hydrolase n=1 Tax=Tenacibaculum sp. C7A-26P2 TaxID=3447504 RepID=UPI003F86582C
MFFTQQKRAIDTIIIKKLILQTFNEKDVIGASIIIVKNEKVYFEKGFNLIKKSGSKMTPKTAFGIASMTKYFTGFTIM